MEIQYKGTLFLIRADRWGKWGKREIIRLDGCILQTKDSCLTWVWISKGKTIHRKKWSNVFLNYPFVTFPSSLGEIKDTYYDILNELEMKTQLLKDTKKDPIKTKDGKLSKKYIKQISNLKFHIKDINLVKRQYEKNFKHIIFPNAVRFIDSI